MTTVEPRPHQPRPTYVDPLAATYGAVTATVVDLPEKSFARPTRAAGWTVRDLLLHQLLDAQRALVALATPTDRSPDVDATTYWEEFRPTDNQGPPHDDFVKVVAAAFASQRGIVELWRETSAAAVHAARSAPVEGNVATQGRVLTVPDFVDTLVVEAAVHQLDLTLEVPGPQPPAAALESVRRVLTGLLGTDLPGTWTDVESALKGTGREPLTDGDRAALGGAAGRFPLFG